MSEGYIHTCNASAAVAKLGFHSVPGFGLPLHDRKAATSSICSAASSMGYNSEFVKSTRPRSWTHSSFSFASRCSVRQFAGFAAPGTLPTFTNFWYTNSWIHLCAAFCFQPLGVWQFAGLWAHQSTCVGFQTSDRNPPHLIV